jgi:RNA polymerase sigma-70 factor (ECF subfamily)
MEAICGSKKETTQSMDEALQRAAQGDSAAFAELVHAHRTMVFSLAYHFLHDRALAEELAQEVFLHLYQNLPRIESSRHLVFWLRKVASHRCIDWLRNNRHRGQVSLEEIADPPAPNNGGDPLLAETLRRLVATLPERARLVVTLRYQEDLQPTEIAGILNMPVNTVKSTLHRALATLQERLIEKEGASA